MLIEEVEATRIVGEAITWPFDVRVMTIPRHYPGGLLFGTQGEQVAPARDSGGLYTSLEALSARVEPAPDPLITPSTKLMTLFRWQHIGRGVHENSSLPTWVWPV
jgi:hypothetical protein